MNSQEFYYFFKDCKKDKQFNYGSFINTPRKIEQDYSDFIICKGFDKIQNHKVIEMAKKRGVIIDYNFSYYKTHVGIFVNDNIYICEQHESRITSCLKTLYFLNIINFN